MKKIAKKQKLVLVRERIKTLIEEVPDAELRRVIGGLTGSNTSDTKDNSTTILC